MNYGNATPPGTFIHSYLEHMREQETATAYDFWTAMWIIGSILGRSVVVSRPRAPVFLNMYVILVAESGITRKSSSIRKAISIVRSLLDHTPVGLIESKVNSTELLYTLYDRSRKRGSAQIALASSELAAVVSRYTRTVPFFTDLYDCPDSYSIENATINHLWVSFLSASTPTWLFRSVHPSMIEGGFTSRCYFIVADRPKSKIAWPTETDTTPPMEPLYRILGMARETPEIGLAPTAVDTFRGWYAKRRTNSDHYRNSFESREDAHILRVAALLSINDNTWLVQERHIMLAISLVAHVKNSGYELFGQADGATTRWITGVEALRSALTTGKPIPRSRAYLRCRTYLDNTEFSALLDTLHESGFIERYEQHHAGPGRPTELLKGTALLRARGVVNQIADLFT